jgi:hypothetical protein
MLISFSNSRVAEGDRPIVPKNSSLLFYLVVAGASDFPHSRQDDLDRDVINPQNGHILCDAKPRTGGVSDANSLEKDAVIVASRLRKRSRNRRKARSISDPPSFFLPMHGWFRDEATGWSALEEGLPLRISAKLTMTRRG